MKVHHLFEMKGIFSLMLPKLVARGEPVAVNAKGRTYRTGNPMFGFRSERSHYKGWVIQQPLHRSSGQTLDPVERVRYRLSHFDLDISNSKAYAMNGTNLGRIDSLFQFETPIDDHYTIKKIDGVWTIVDREKVEESIDHA